MSKKKEHDLLDLSGSDSSEVELLKSKCLELESKLALAVLSADTAQKSHEEFKKSLRSALHSGRERLDIGYCNLIALLYGEGQIVLLEEVCRGVNSTAGLQRMIDVFRSAKPMWRCENVTPYRAIATSVNHNGRK